MTPTPEQLPSLSANLTCFQFIYFRALAETLAPRQEKAPEFKCGCKKASPGLVGFPWFSACCSYSCTADLIPRGWNLGKEVAFIVTERKHLCFLFLLMWNERRKWEQQQLTRGGLGAHGATDDLVCADFVFRVISSLTTDTTPFRETSDDIYLFLVDLVDSFFQLLLWVLKRGTHVP